MGLGQAVGAGDQHQRAFPELLFLVVLREAGAQVAGLADVDLLLGAVLGLTEQEVQRDLFALGHLQEVLQQAARHLDDLDDPGRDLGHAYAPGIAAGQEYLDGLGGGAHAASSRVAVPRTSILPVTAAEIRALRRSFNRAIPFSPR